VKVFISWSGERSHIFARALHQWLKDVNAMIAPWMSAADIEAGERWGAAVDAELADTSIGILCLTKENLYEPWIHFEAGALAKSVSTARVCPLLLDLAPADVPGGPLARFQAKRADRGGVREVLITINRAMDAGRLSDQQLERVFDRWWPDLEAALTTIPVVPTAANTPTDEQMLSEILEHVRTLARRASEPDLRIGDADYEMKNIRFKPLRVRRGPDGRLIRMIDLGELTDEPTEQPE
jgi:hypothetical protein